MRRVQNVEPVKLGAEVMLGPESYTAGPTCASKNAGHWHCVTHHVGFMNQLQKDGHIHDDRKRHVLAWICNEHGPEVP